MKKSNTNKKLSKNILFILISLLFLVLFSSCQGGERSNEITKVLYSEKNEKIEISATLDPQTAKLYKHDTVYLMEIPAHMSIDDIVTLIPVAQKKANKQMSFSIPLINGAKTSLYSGFALAIFDQSEGYVAISDVKYLENPESLAKNSDSYPAYSSSKGLYIASLSDAVSLGVHHTVIRIPIEEYMAHGDESSKAITCSFDGNTYYINSEKVSALDYKIKNLTDAGIEVFLEFTLDSSPDELPNELSDLALMQKTQKPSASDTKEDPETPESSNPSSQNAENVHYALSLNSIESYGHLASLFEFFAARYTRQDGLYGFAGAYIICQGVNSLSSTNIDSPRTLSESASNYARILRLASTALRSSYAQGKIYASINNLWNCSEADSAVLSTTDTSSVSDSVTSQTKDDDNLPKPQRTEFGGKEYLTALEKALSESGSIKYGVALIPNPSSDLSGSVWMDDKAVNAQSTVTLSVKNLSVLNEFLSKDSMLYLGEKKNILIYNYSISSSIPDAMAASYAYAYYKATEAGVDAFIYNGQWDNATGNGESGLWKTDSNGEPIETRPIYNVFKTIDQKGSGQPEQARARIGTEWDNLYNKYSQKIQKALFSNGSAVTVPDTKTLSKLSEVLLYDFSSGNSEGFFPSDSALYVEIANNASGGKVLKAALSPRYKGENAGIRSASIPFDNFAKAKIITMTLCADLPDSNTGKVTLALSQSNEKGSSFFSSTATVQAGNWQTVYFNLDEIKLKESFGDVKMWLWLEADGIPVKSDSENSNTGYELNVKTVSISSKKGGSALLVVFIVILILAMIAFLIYRFWLYPPKAPIFPYRKRMGNQSTEKVNQHFRGKSVKGIKNPQNQKNRRNPGAPQMPPSSARQYKRLQNADRVNPPRQNVNYSPQRQEVNPHSYNRYNNQRTK